jgi:hypothetical protein
MLFFIGLYYLRYNFKKVKGETMAMKLNETVKLGVYTVVESTKNGEHTFYEADSMGDLLEYLKKFDRGTDNKFVKIYEKNTPLVHDYFHTLPDDYEGEWFISHIEYDGLMTGYFFKNPKEIKEVLDDLIKKAQGDSHHREYGKAYTSIFPPDAKTIELETIELIKTFSAI